MRDVDKVRRKRAVCGSYESYQYQSITTNQVSELSRLPSGDGVASTRVRARKVYSKPDLNPVIDLCMKFGQIIKKMVPVS